ncbi:BLUF domain-containing protein [Sphingomonas mesophila]|uniref:BLUF domain-containing protein n=1 Tax=Sphingomonas mesophila TaxID=2303576 RepID=UPI000E56AADF|nr:BLUF domain-containing protein [Sphingomonas mesophila]
MLQIVYISTMRGPISRTECDLILAASRRNNPGAGITGLLVVGGNRFLQLLEGPEDAVEACLARIRSDPRHFALVVLDKRQVAERACPDWAMGYRTGGGAGGEGSLEQIVEALVAPIEEPYLKAQFTSFAKLQDRAA